jgi:uncharacterized membrane protein
MNKYATYYYLLFVLLIMGAFASMAQNDYGIEILGLVAVAFSFLFLIQLISSFNKRRESKDASGAIELFSLVLLSGILSLRVFYIRFPFVEIVFGIAGLLLVLVYVYKLNKSYKLNCHKSKVMTWLVLLFQMSIILYIASMITVAFLPFLSEPTGGAAFALILAFIFISLVKRKIMVGSESISAFSFVARFKDCSVLLITLFLLFTAYMGFTKIGVLPKMYSDEFPQAYFELVNQAESGKEKPVNGAFKHEEFKANYDRFVKRNSSESKK